MGRALIVSAGASSNEYISARLAYSLGNNLHPQSFRQMNNIAYD